MEELEKILKQNNRPIVKRGSQNSNIGTTAARSGNLNAYNKERYNLSNPTSTNHKPDGATKPNNAFSAAGQRVLNNVPPPVSINPRSSGRVLAAGEKALPRSPEKAEEHDDFVGSWIRNQTQKNVPTISSKPPQPRSGQNDGSMIEVLKQRAAAKAKAETKSAAESRQRNTDNRSSTANQTSINGFEDEDSLMQLALEMSLKEQQAKIHQQIPSNVRISSRDEELGMLNERSSAMMRDFLHNNDAMPAWLQQSINKSAEEDLLNLTAAFSTNEGYSNNHTFSSSSSALTSNYSHFLQEDEDEMLAKALKDIDELESLNREANNKQDYRSTLIEGTDEDQLLAKAIEKIERDDREKQEKAKETEDEELARAIQDSLQFN